MKNRANVFQLAFRLFNFRNNKDFSPGKKNIGKLCKHRKAPQINTMYALRPLALKYIRFGRKGGGACIQDKRSRGVLSSSPSRGSDGTCEGGERGCHGNIHSTPAPGGLAYMRRSRLGALINQSAHQQE